MIPDGHRHIFHLFTAFFQMIVHCKEWLKGEGKARRLQSVGGGDDWIEVIIETAGLLAITPLRLPD
jgi:hypothetical protein